jgi:hypothetical protein
VLFFRPYFEAGFWGFSGKMCRKLYRKMLENMGENVWKNAGKMCRKMWGKTLEKCGEN